MSTNVRTVVRPTHQFRPRMLDVVPDPVGGTSPRFLVTIFRVDRADVLRHTLSWLREGHAPPDDAHIQCEHIRFSIQSLVAASLSGIGVIALVTSPVPAEQDDSLGDEIDDLEGEALTTWIEGSLTAHLLEHLPTDDGDLSVKVQPVARADENRIYRGREFREVRFGLPRTRKDIAVDCGQIIDKFAEAVSKQELPLAYLYYPNDSLGADANGTEIDDTAYRWLQIGYAVDADAGVRTALDLEAWKIAREFSVPLRVYQPGPPDLPMSFPLLYVPEKDGKERGDPPPEDKVGVCLQGLAKLGLVNRMRAATTGMHVYGMLASALRGHAVCNVILDRRHLKTLMERLDEGLMVRQTVTTELLADPAERTSFWVAWRCKEAHQVLDHVLEPVYDVFDDDDPGVVPNIDYMIMRILDGGTTSAGKIRLSLPGRRAEAMPLATVRREIEEKLAPLLQGWRPGAETWRDRPVTVSRDEPREEPWASLVGPEGVIMGRVLADQLGGPEEDDDDDD